MKYIDSEKLIAELTRMQFDLNAAYRHPQSDSIVRAISLEYDDILSLVDSLQQEQPKPTCKTCGFYENNCPFIRGKFIQYPNKVCKDYTYSVIKEQPEVDLEKEIKNYLATKCADDDEPSVSDIARHFAEWGAIHLNARKED